MSKAFSLFYDYVMPELPGVTTAMVDQHLLQVARDFCERTSCWRDTFPLIDAQPDTSTYFIPVAASRAELVRVLNLHVAGTWLWSSQDPKPSDQDTPQFAPGQPPFSVNADLDQITLDDVPDGQIELEAAMRPQLSTAQLPNVLLARYVDAMRDGVHARLMRMGGKPWSDPQLALEKRRDYHAAIGRAAYQAAHGNTRAQLRTRPTLI